MQTTAWVWILFVTRKVLTLPAFSAHFTILRVLAATAETSGWAQRQLIPEYYPRKSDCQPSPRTKNRNQNIRTETRSPVGQRKGAMPSDKATVYWQSHPSPMNHSGPFFRSFFTSISNISDAVRICWFFTVRFHQSYLLRVPHQCTNPVNKVAMAGTVASTLASKVTATLVSKTVAAADAAMRITVVRRFVCSISENALVLL